MDYALEITDLCKDYNGFNLKNVSFNVPKGSIMGFIGENGAGKTTTIKLILNLIKRNNGDIKVLGLDNISDEKQIKQNVGVVLEGSYFHDYLTPSDISKIMRNIYQNWDNAQYLKYLNRFKLPENKVIKEFSKGMKMKLSIAAALSHESKLLILDEPTSGLDPVVRNEILDILWDYIQNEERAVLISSHITSDLERIADYITFIHDGEIVFSESKDDLINTHGMLKCGADDFKKIDEPDILGYRKSQFGYEILVKRETRNENKYKDFVVDSINIDDIMLFYGRGEV